MVSLNAAHLMHSFNKYLPNALYQWRLSTGDTEINKKRCVLKELQFQCRQVNSCTVMNKFYVKMFSRALWNQRGGSAYLGLKVRGKVSLIKLCKT